MYVFIISNTQVFILVVMISRYVLYRTGTSTLSSTVLRRTQSTIYIKTIIRQSHQMLLPSKIVDIILVMTIKQASQISYIIYHVVEGLASRSYRQSFYLELKYFI